MAEESQGLSPSEDDNAYNAALMATSVEDIERALAGIVSPGRANEITQLIAAKRDENKNIQAQPIQGSSTVPVQSDMITDKPPQSQATAPVVIFNDAGEASKEADDKIKALGDVQKAAADLAAALHKTGDADKIANNAISSAGGLDATPDSVEKAAGDLEAKATQIRTASTIKALIGITGGTEVAQGADFGRWPPPATGNVAALDKNEGFGKSTA